MVVRFLIVNGCWFKNKKNRESQYMVSHPETGSDSPIGSDRDRGRDRNGRPVVDRKSGETIPI